MKILLPLLSRQEFDEVFLEEALKGVKEVVLLLVIDTNAMSGEVGFAASEIMQGNQLMEKVKEVIGKKRKKCTEVTEWGDTARKIVNEAKIHKVNQIVLMKQENHYWSQLEEILRNEFKDVAVFEGKKEDLTLEKSSDAKKEEKAEDKT
ncbi:MAG: hypothetical protein ABIE23_03850 [archaeon]